MKRRTSREQPAAAPEPGVDQVLFLKRDLAAVKNERDQLRARVDGLELTITAQARELDKARNHVAGSCEHAKAARDLVHTLYAQERVIAELQAVNEGYESRRWQPRDVPVAVPQQRGGKRR